MQSLIVIIVSVIAAKVYQMELTAAIHLSVGTGKLLVTMDSAFISSEDTHHFCIGTSAFPHQPIQG